MPKLTDYVQTETPWNAKLSDIQDKAVRMFSLQPIETAYGTGYLVGCNVLNSPTDLGDDLVVIAGGAALTDKLGELYEKHPTPDNLGGIDVVFYRVASSKRPYWFIREATQEDMNIPF